MRTLSACPAGYVCLLSICGEAHSISDCYNRQVIALTYCAERRRSRPHTAPGISFALGRHRFTFGVHRLHCTSGQWSQPIRLMPWSPPSISRWMRLSAGRWAACPTRILRRIHFSLPRISELGWIIPEQVLSPVLCYKNSVSARQRTGGD